MFVLIKADNNGTVCNDDCEGKTSAMVFEHYDDAFDEMASQVKKELIERDIEFATDVNGDIDRYDSGTYEIDDYFSYVDPYSDGPVWKIVEAKVPDSPTHKRNPNVAETVGYECKNDPSFRSRDMLLHQATVRWYSGKSFECHAPERVELRIGGTSYEYKAI